MPRTVSSSSTGIRGMLSIFPSRAANKSSNSETTSRGAGPLPLQPCLIPMATRNPPPMRSPHGFRTTPLETQSPAPRLQERAFAPLLPRAQGRLLPPEPQPQPRKLVVPLLRLRRHQLPHPPAGMYRFLPNFFSPSDSEDHCSASAEWGQCGGIGWTGCTSCASGTTCQQLNACE